MRPLIRLPREFIARVLHALEPNLVGAFVVGGIDVNVVARCLVNKLVEMIFKRLSTVQTS